MALCNSSCCRSVRNGPRLIHRHSLRRLQNGTFPSFSRRCSVFFTCLHVSFLCFGCFWCLLAFRELLNMHSSGGGGGGRDHCPAGAPDPGGAFGTSTAAVPHGACQALSKGLLKSRPAARRPVPAPPKRRWATCCCRPRAAVLGPIKRSALQFQGTERGKGTPWGGGGRSGSQEPARLAESGCGAYEPLYSIL